MFETVESAFKFEIHSKIKNYVQCVRSMRWGFSWKSLFDFLYTNSFKMGRFPIWFGQLVRDWGEKRWDFFYFLVPTFDFTNTQTTEINLNWNEMTSPFAICYRAGCPLCPVASTAHRNFPIDFSFQCVFVFRVSRIQNHHPQLATADTTASTRYSGLQRGEMNQINPLFYSIALKTYEIGNPNWNRNPF